MTLTLGLSLKNAHLIMLMDKHIQHHTPATSDVLGLRYTNYLHGSTFKVCISTIKTHR